MKDSPLPADREKTAAAGKSRTAPDGKRGVTLKIQVDLPGGSRLGPGKIQLLELIASQGSLSRAAVAMGISYRRAWLFVQHVNTAFDTPAVATAEDGRGGSSAQLTEFGRELIARFRKLEEDVRGSSTENLKWLERHRQSATQSD